MFTKKTLKDINIKNKKLIMRVDFNVPLDENGHILDDTRIKYVIPSILYAMKNEASVVLLTHLGRPKRKQGKYSILPIYKRLRELLPLDYKVSMLNSCVDSDVINCVNKIKKYEIIICENIRFHYQEDMHIKNNRDRIEQNNFAKKLAKLGDIYVNDAFGVIHRNHASLSLLCRYTMHAVAGLLLEKELNQLYELINNTRSPFVVIVGGSKVSDKIWSIRKLIPRVNYILIGGGIAYTFLVANGVKVGKSICDIQYIDIAKEIMELALFYNTKILLPIDHVVVNDNINNYKTMHIVEDDIPNECIGLDIGPKTIAKYKEIIENASTIVWNGPMGFFEMNDFARGTISIGKLISASKAISMISGGDSIAALTLGHCIDNIQYISTGGGSVLEFLADDGILPGLIGIEERDNDV